jgi:hypothetical protein
MKKLMIGLVAAALLPLSASVQAKTLCFTAFGGMDRVKLTGLTSLKKPGSISSFKGIWVGNNTYVMPLQGTAATNPNGSIRIGFTLHAITAYGSNIHLESVVPDQTLVGTYSYDNTGDRAIDSSTPLVTMNCKDFTLPPLV